MKRKPPKQRKAALQLQSPVTGIDYLSDYLLITYYEFKQG